MCVCLCLCIIHLGGGSHAGLIASPPGESLELIKSDPWLIL